MEKRSNINFFSFQYSQDSFVQGELNFGGSGNKCRAKDPEHCRVHGNTENRFLEDTRKWASRVSTSSLAQYLRDHESDPRYDEAIKIILEEADRRARADNYGIHPESM